MAVYDRWHLSDPQPGDQPCRCGRGRNRLYPSADHEGGDRWQVRWRDPGTGRQRKRNFAERDGDDPDLHARAFDKVIAGQIVTRTYVDPKSAQVTFREYAEQWRTSRKLDANGAADLERRLRNHVYEDPKRPGSGRTPKGGVSIGQHPMGLLAQRASLTAAWVTAMPLAAGSAGKVVDTVSAVCRAAIDDGVIGRDPTGAASVTRPKRLRRQGRPWTVEQVDAMAAELHEFQPRYAVIPELGAATGMRQGEMFGLGTDAVDWLKRDDPRVHVMRQLKWVDGLGLCFGPIKNRKPHSAPLAASLKERLQRHLDEYPARDVRLPWYDPGDRDRHMQPVAVRLVLTTGQGAAIERSLFDYHWRKARKRAGITPEDRRGRDDGTHALRRTFVSVQLRNGVDIVRVASWIGDTVQVVAATYAYLLPGGSDDDGRSAVDGFFSGRDLDRNVPGEAAE